MRVLTNVSKAELDYLTNQPTAKKMIEKVKSEGIYILEGDAQAAADFVGESGLPGLREAFGAAAGVVRLALHPACRRSQLFLLRPGAAEQSARLWPGLLTEGGCVCAYL